MNPACCKMRILAKHGKTASKSVWHRIFEETRFTYWGGSESSSLVLATKHCQATLKSHLQLTCQALHTWDSSTRPCGGHVYLHALYQVILSQPNLENIRTHENLSKTYRAWKISCGDACFCSSCQVLSLSLLGILTIRMYIYIYVCVPRSSHFQYFPAKGMKFWCVTFLFSPSSPNHRGHQATSGTKQGENGTFHVLRGTCPRCEGWRLPATLQKKVCF